MVQREMQSMTVRLVMLQPPGQGGFAHVGSAHQAAFPQPPSVAAGFAYVGIAPVAPSPSQTHKNVGYSLAAISVPLPAAATPPFGALTAEERAEPAEPAFAPAESLPNYRLPDRVF